MRFSLHSLKPLCLAAAIILLNGCVYEVPPPPVAVAPGPAVVAAPCCYAYPEYPPYYYGPYYGGPSISFGYIGHEGHWGHGHWR